MHNYLKDNYLAPKYLTILNLTILHLAYKKAFLSIYTYILYIIVIIYNI